MPQLPLYYLCFHPEVHLAPDTAAEVSATPTLSSLNAPNNLLVPDMPPTVPAITVMKTAMMQ